MPNYTYIPNFRYLHSAGYTYEVDASGPEMELYTCLRVAFGWPVEMDSGGQGSQKKKRAGSTRASRREAMEISANDKIALQAATVTKCIINYMYSGAESAKIIKYGEDFTGEFNLDVQDLIDDEDGWSQTWGQRAKDTHGIMTDFDDVAQFDVTLEADTAYYLKEVEGQAVFDINEDIYEDLYYMASPQNLIMCETTIPSESDD